MKKISSLKKIAVSEIISSVLLILVVISMITIISVYVRNQVNLSPQFSCADMKFNPPVTIKKACFNSTSGDAEITLARTSSSEIKEIDLLMQNSNESSRFAIGENCQSCEMLNQGETRAYFISGNFQSISTRISNCLIESVKVENCGYTK